MIDYTNNILFIDLSYYIFYRFYALCTWIKMSKAECETNMNDEVFKEKYEKCFFQNIIKLTKLYKVKPDNVIFACDCSRDSIWRKELHPEYKGTRETKDSFDPHVFIHTHEKLLPILIERHGFKILKCQNAEADDIIGVLTRTITEKYRDTSITIITNDNDYLQLIMNENIKIYNLKKQDLSTRSVGNYQKDLLYKILVGDKSDNIQGLVVNKVAMNLINECDEDEIESRMIDMDKYEKYLFNKTMIDMRLIPTEIQDNIKNLLS